MNILRSLSEKGVGSGGRLEMVLMFAILAVATSGALSLGVSAPPPPHAFPSYAELADSVDQAVVNIFTTKVTELNVPRQFGDPDSPFGDFFRHFFGNRSMKRKTTALGSGFIIDPKGYILTNHHVVKKADEIKVRLSDKHEYSASIVGRDPKTDLALIKVEPDSNFPAPATLGDSENLRVGDTVMAVGNPFGLGHTVTVGIISAKSRVIGAGPYDDFLQTDAAINPGNSGGPLFNVRGEVVGINTAIVARGQNIGFAIPVNMAQELLPQLKNGRVIRGWLGVVIQDIDDKLARSFDLKTTEGVLVAQVQEDSPADIAGLKRGDVILKLDGQTISDSHLLSRRVAALEPGSTARLRILRDNDERTLRVKIGTLPEEDDQLAGTGLAKPIEKKWGFAVTALNEQVARQLGYDENETGVVITRVTPMSPAAEAGVRRGDLIKEINRNTVETMADFKHFTNRLKSEDNLLLLVKRGGQSFYIVLEKE